jgi:hypothetical protein
MAARHRPPSRYACEDYLASPWAIEGLWDESAQLWLIEPLARIEDHADIGFLEVGRPGVDGIGFGYRADEAGFWAYHPMERPFQWLAPSLETFIGGWRAGRLTV